MSFKFGIKPYFKTPKRMKKEPSLTISQIARGVSKETRMKSRIVGIESVYEGNVPKALEGYTCYRFTTRNTENGHQYKLAVFSPTKKVTLESRVVLDSPNALFVFKYEYALAKRGNAFIYRTNGNPPVQTNPGLKPGMDHHMYRALQYLIKHTTKNGLSASKMK